MEQPDTLETNGQQQEQQHTEAEQEQQGESVSHEQQQEQQPQHDQPNESNEHDEEEQHQEGKSEEKDEKSAEMLTVERGAKKMLSTMTREQITMLLVRAAVSHTDVFDSVKAMSEKDSTKLFVRELSFKTTSETLKEAFSEYGEVADASVVEDRVTKKSRGYGFVTFKTAEAAQKALASTGKIVDGRATQVVTYAARAGEKDGSNPAGSKRPRASYETPSRGYYPSSSSSRGGGGYDDRYARGGSSYRDNYREDYYAPRDSYYDSRDRGYARDGYSSRPAPYYPPAPTSYRDDRAAYDRVPPRDTRYDSAVSAGYPSSYAPPAPSSSAYRPGYPSY